MGQLRKGERGWYARVGGKNRWVCSIKQAKTRREADAIFHRKATAWTGGAVVRDAVTHRRASPADFTVHDLLNAWIIDRRNDAHRGELSPGAWTQYKLSAKRLDAVFGQMRTDDVTPDTIRDVYGHLVKSHGADFAKRAIGHLRQAANHGADAGWCRPVRLGRTGKLTGRPQPVMRWRLFTPHEVVQILKRLDRKIVVSRGRKDGRTLPSLIQLRAMVYLALNGGFNATECSELTRASVDLDAAVIKHVRGKTGVEHVVPLWAETVDALREAMRLRPDDDLIFRTREGQPWTRSVGVEEGGRLKRTIWHDNIAFRFRELIEPMGLKIRGQSFGKLRHLFATTADTSQDRNAVARLMGHSLGVQAHYVKIDVGRLRAVVDHVRSVLLNPQERSPDKSQTTPAGTAPHA